VKNLEQKVMLGAMLCGGMVPMLAVGVEGGPVSLVRDGGAIATIILAAETEWDLYTHMTTEALASLARKRFPNASTERLEEVIATLPALLAQEAQRVGDEELLAAEELVAFVKKLSGADLPIHRIKSNQPLPEGSLILLGSELARRAGLGADLDALLPDGFVIRTTPNHLILSGRRARGTLYAVYEWLESLGCRWVMPGPFGEIIPEMTTIEVTTNTVQNPSHRQRYWWCTWGHGEAYPRWTLRNKGNFIRALGDAVVQQSHASQVPLTYGSNRKDLQVKVRQDVPDWKRDEKGQVLRDEAGQPLERVMVEKDVFQLPDEYYTMVGGTPNTHLANMSNPKVWDLCTEYYRDVYFYEHPLEDYVSISAADGLTLDDRKESRQLDSNEFDWTIGAYASSDRLWFFHRRYIDRVIQEHPDRRFGVLVYANNMTPPRIESVHPSMALVFAPLGICPLHHVRDDKCKTNRAYKDWFKAWMAQARAVGAETYYYDYLPIGFQWCNFIISPQWAIIGRNYPWFHEQGLDGHTSQGFDDWGAMGLTAWVAVRLYWDVEQDYDDLVEDYCRIRFGTKAAAAMHQYYKVYEDRMDVVPDLCGNEIWGNHLTIDAATREKGRDLLKKAGTLVEGKRAREHFETVDQFQQAMDAWCGGVEHARETGKFSEAAKQLEPAFEIADALNSKYSHFVHPKRIDKTSETLFRPGGWYHKYLAWAEFIEASGASLCLPRYMKVALDSLNTSWTKGWQLPEVSVDQLEAWDTTVVPDIKYGTQREPAAFFYRTEIDVPKAFAQHAKIELFFPSLIARALRIWVNGEPVLFDYGDYKDEVWRGPAYFWVDYDHQQHFDVTAHITPGERNTIAFRVFKATDHGGTYDRVFLLADPPDAKKGQES